MKTSYDELLEQNIILRRENAQLREENIKLREENIKLREENAKLYEIIKKLESRITDLELRLNKNSKNSSKPPSTDQKPNLPQAPKKESRPFHKGMSRKLLPESSVTSRETRIIENCPRCGSSMELTGEVSKWQQIELPEIKPLVHQIELHTCRCTRCLLEVRPSLAEHEKYLLGSRFEALINVLLGQFRQSHDQVRNLLSAMIPQFCISKGLISKIKKRAAKALRPIHQELMNRVIHSKEPIHVDPTGWRHLGQNSHVVVARVGALIVYNIISHQNRETLNGLFNREKVHHLITDRGKPVQNIAAKLHQYCLAHLLRNIRGIAEDSRITIEHTTLLGEIYDLIQDVFRDKHRLDLGEISTSTWHAYGYEKWCLVKEILEEILETCLDKKLIRFCKSFLTDLKHFKVYLRNPSYPMTNNPAEEALRTVVISRKLSFGSRSMYGQDWRAVIHSYIETLRRQGQAVVDFLAQVTFSYRMNSPVPSIFS